jgi:hypothetical protein
MTPEAADRTVRDFTKAAAELGDNWSYKAMHDPKKTGQSFVLVLDETGKEVGKL